MRDSLEILQEFQQSVSFRIFLAVFRNLLQQWFCLHLEHGQLIEHRRIEHRIGILLEREYPFVLASSYRWPAVNGLLSRYTSIFIVADDAAQQTVVGCRNIIMIIQQDGSQCRSIYAVNLLFRNMRRQFRGRTSTK